LLQGVVNPLTNRLDFSIQKVVDVSELDTSVQVHIVRAVILNQGLTGLSVNSQLINRGGLAVSDGNEHCDCECKEYVALDCYRKPTIMMAKCSNQNLTVRLRFQTRLGAAELGEPCATGATKLASQPTIKKEAKVKLN